MSPTDRFRFATKTALAITITYAIPLWMDWDKAYWAAFAAAFISLETYGQSIQKGARRFAGTIVGAVAAFALLALFPQDRWLFVLALSLFVAFCTLVAVGSQRSYFWMSSAVACALVALSAEPSSEGVFERGILRAQETALGVLVFGVVSALLWPTSSGGKFRSVARDVGSGHAQYFRLCADILRGGDHSPADTRRAKLRRLRDQANGLLEAAALDDSAIWEARRAWRAYQAERNRLGERLNRWRQSVEDLSEPALREVLPSLDDILDGLAERLDALAKDPEETVVPGFAPLPVEIDEGALARLRPFARAAVSVAVERLGAIEESTRALADAAAAIRGERASPATSSDAPCLAVWLLDPDRLTAALRTIIAIWVAFAFYVYIPDTPGGLTLLILAASLSANFAIVPFARVSMLVQPLIYALTLGSVVTIFVLPQISGFLMLGPLLFVIHFAIYWRFSAPQDVIHRSACVSIFAVLTQIDNAQTFSFLQITTVAWMLPLVILALLVSAYLPTRSSPEAAFLRQLNRFADSAGRVLDSMRWSDGPPTALARLRHAADLRALQTTPLAARDLLPFLDPQVAPKAENANRADAVDAAEELGVRLVALAEARARPHAEFAIHALSEDLRTFRLAIKGALSQLRSDAPNVEIADGTRLAEAASRLESRIEAAADVLNASAMTDTERRNMHRYLGSLREVADAVALLARRVAPIDWRLLRETRF